MQIFLSHNSTEEATGEDAGIPLRKREEAPMEEASLKGRGK